MPYAPFPPVSPTTGPATAELLEFAARSPHLDFSRALRQAAAADQSLARGLAKRWNYIDRPRRGVLTLSKGERVS